MMAKMGDQKAIIEQINNKKKSKGKGKNGPDDNFYAEPEGAPTGQGFAMRNTNSDKKQSIAEYFREQINRKN